MLFSLDNNFKFNFVQPLLVKDDWIENVLKYRHIDEMEMYRCWFEK